MADWNPELYNRFRRYRAEPVEHIFGGLPLADEETIADLGCGSGENTIALARRTARGSVRGSDNSVAMIEAARAALANEPEELRNRVSFDLCGLADFRAREEFTVIFSNAAFHWVREQRPLFEACLAALKRKGRIVVQVPANEIETGKLELARLAAEEPWRAMLGGLQKPFRDPEPQFYRSMLTEIGFDSVDCYYHTFQHPMDRPTDVVEWYRATGLRPFLDRLAPDRHQEFTAAYVRRLEAAYGTSGPMTFKFRRLFIWARRPPR